LKKVFTDLQIDGALLRPGRLDRLLKCSMPDQISRAAILRASLLASGTILSSDVALDDIASATQGLSGADLRALVGSVQLAAVHHHLRTGSPVQISSSMFATQLSDLRPSISAAVS
jgi:peroxin-1